MSKTVVITGASRGIGKAIALAFAGKDVNIVINCVHQKSKLEEVRENIMKQGTRCEMYIGDISDYSTSQDLFAMVKTTFGGTDILINNAGISMIGLFQDLSRNDWEQIINTNLGSVYNCCHFAIPDMVHQHSGKIINISSVWGIAGASCEVAYSASKGAINALTRALAKELAPSSIQVNAVACGAIHTDMNAFLNKEEMEALIEEIPSGRLGTPDEVASFVYELATGNDYLTGQVIQLDGGWI